MLFTLRHVRRLTAGPLRPPLQLFALGALLLTAASISKLGSEKALRFGIQFLLSVLELWWALQTGLQRVSCF